MTLARNIGLIIAATAIWTASSDHAAAQFGGGPGAMFYGFSGGSLYNSNGQSPPYYAMFPPVYYSHPVARPYGYSPFAYPPGYMTPQVALPQAREIVNPYVPRKRVAASVDHTASAPQVILNPYVKQRSPSLAARPSTEAARQNDLAESVGSN